MRYLEIAPHPALRRYVRCYWMLEDAAASAEIQRVVPDGRAEFIFNLGNPYETFTGGVWKCQPECFLFGQITGPLLLRPSGPTRIAAIRFHTHTAGLLLKVPMPEIADTALPLGDISGRLARRFDILREARTPRAQAAVLDRIVIALAGATAGEDTLVAAAISRLSQSMSVSAAARHTGLSPRQLERRFHQSTGIPPKLFARMQRFQRVFPALESESTGWTGTALACGYYDQSHLIRDFREFAGKPPAALLAENTDLARHFLQHSPMSHFSNTGAAPSR